MEDTLRYYFSTLFQGFAAVITLGAMYFLYFFDRIESQKKEIIGKLNIHYTNTEREFILIHGIVDYVKQKLLPLKKDIPQYDYERTLVNKFDSLLAVNTNIQNYLPKLLKQTISILIISLVSLFIVGYNIYLNYALVLVGVVCLFLSIKLLLLIKKVVLEIIFVKID